MRQLKDARVPHGLTQAELAVRAGISRPTVARVEAGEDVSTATLEKVAGALGLGLMLRAAPGRQVRSRVALPEDTYLARIGEVAYAVSSMEWTLLGDLHRLADPVARKSHAGGAGAAHHGNNRTTGRERC